MYKKIQDIRKYNTKKYKTRVCLLHIKRISSLGKKKISSKYKDICKKIQDIRKYSIRNIRQELAYYI